MSRDVDRREFLKTARTVAGAAAYAAAWPNAAAFKPSGLQASKPLYLISRSSISNTSMPLGAPGGPPPAS
jgi:hypothetical protein